MLASKGLDINVLKVSVEEHENQLKWHLHGPLNRFFHKLFLQGKKKPNPPKDGEKNNHPDLSTFVDNLRLVPDWNQKTINDVVGLVCKWVKNKHFKIEESIKTVIIGRTMLMVAMSGDGDAANRIRIDLPDKNAFIHTIMSFIASDIHADPSLMKIHNSDTESDLRQKEETVRTINAAAIDHPNIEHHACPSVFAYMSSAMSADHFTGGGGPDVKAQEEEEDEEEEVEEEEAATDAEIEVVAKEVMEYVPDDDDELGFEDETVVPPAIAAAPVAVLDTFTE